MSLKIKDSTVLNKYVVKLNLRNKKERYKIISNENDVGTVNKVLID